MGKTSYHCKDEPQGWRLFSSLPGRVCLSPAEGMPASFSPPPPGEAASVAPSVVTTQPVYVARMLPVTVKQIRWLFDDNSGIVFPFSP